MDIRDATSLDQTAIHAVHWSAFSAEERERVAGLAIELLSENVAPPVLSLVADIAGDMVGHVAFSPVTIHHSETIQGYILAPLGVRPDHQRQQIGTRLIEHGMQRLSAMGVDILFVYGDPNYYGRFGFKAEIAESYVPPYTLQYPFGWQAIVLTERRVETSRLKIDVVPSLSDPDLW